MLFESGCGEEGVTLYTLPIDKKIKIKRSCTLPDPVLFPGLQINK